MAATIDQIAETSADLISRLYSGDLELERSSGRLVRAAVTFNVRGYLRLTVTLTGVNASETSPQFVLLRVACYAVEDFPDIAVRVQSDGVHVAGNNAMLHGQASDVVEAVTEVLTDTSGIVRTQLVFGAIPGIPHN